MNSEIKNLKSFTVQELQEKFNDVIDIVENGECIVITTEKGNVLMVPYREMVDIYEDDLT